MDIFEQMSCLTKTVEAHGKTWLLIQSLNSNEAGTYYLAAELGINCPAPVHIIQIPKPQPSRESAKEKTNV